MHIVLIEPHFTGHRPTYLYFYSKLLIDSGNKVSIICGEPEACRQFINGQKKLPEVNVFPFKTLKKKYSFFKKYFFYPRYEYWRRLKISLKPVPDFDFVLFMYFDFFLFDFNLVPRIGRFLTNNFLPYYINKIIPVKWCGILFHPVHSRYVNYDYLNRVANCSIGILDETYPLHVNLKNKYIWPDAIEEQKIDRISALGEEVLKKANGRKIISLLGSLEKRKGILPFIEAIEQMDSDSYFFIIAGFLDTNYSEDEMKRVKNFHKENCFILLEHVNDLDFHSFIKISDILYLVYIGFLHSSNLLTQAAFYEIPVLCLEDHCMGKRVKKFNLGLTVSEPTADEVKDKLLNFEKLFDTNSGQFKKYFEVHSQEYLQKILNQLIKN